MSEVRVDVWSDIACPWCWVGKRHLEKALAELDQPVALTWRAFELDPRPKDPAAAETPYVERLAAKYATSVADAQGMIDRMTTVGRGVGIDFRFDRAQPTNTFDAHRLLAWAAEAHPDRQDALKEALFSAHLNEGRAMSDGATLLEVVEAVGLDPAAAREVLDSGAFADEVRQEEATAQHLGVRGVPFFVFDGRVAVSGAQPPEVLADALQEALRRAEPSPPSEAGAVEACGPDGCAVPTPEP